MLAAALLVVRMGAAKASIATNNPDFPNATDIAS